MGRLHQAPAGGMNTKIVLLIEDNPSDERLTLRALRKNNIMNEVVVAYDGQEGLDFLFGEGKFEDRKGSEPPALIILDLKLPKVSGVEVLRRIREDDRTRRLPVVVLTSSDDDSEVNTCYELGANSYVRKPTDSAAFADMILSLGMYWLLLNVPPPVMVRR
ncbi:MAG TPA: response regulator [Fimbriimonadaceae bacterium]|nr:response regulator [Fimbriimonadaceae bacterium]HRJ97188.1 response regulator [Fimbriimonadaceae bacterium]